MKETVLTEKQRRAVDLLFQYSDAEVAAKLRVSRQELESWTDEPEFVKAINTTLKANRRAVIRTLSRLYLDACLELHAIIHEKEDKSRHRAMVDILKAGGFLKDKALEEAQSVTELVTKMAEMEEEAAEPVRIADFRL